MTTVSISRLEVLRSLHDVNGPESVTARSAPVCGCKDDVETQSNDKDSHQLGL